MSIDFISLPSVSIVTGHDVLGLSVFRHLVKSDLVGIVKDNQVVKLLVSGEAGGLGGNSLLEASITSKCENVVIEDCVVFGVVDGTGHLLRKSVSDGIGNTLSKGSGGALNSGSSVLRVRELRVTGGLGVVLTEILDLLKGKIVASKVKPGVDEHGSMTSRKDETITVDPGGIFGVVAHLRSVEDSSDLGGSERKSHVTRMGSCNGVHGKTTGLVGGGGKGCLGVDSGRHIKFGNTGSGSEGNIFDGDSSKALDGGGHKRRGGDG